MKWRLPGRGAKRRNPLSGPDPEETLWFPLPPHVGPEAASVIRCDLASATPGWNLVSAADAPAAVLIDNSGREVHRWHIATEDLWSPAELDARRTRESSGFWRSVALLPGGDLLVLQKHLGIARLDASSRVRWKHAADVHHQVVVTPGGDVFALDRRACSRPDRYSGRTHLDDGILRLDSEGRLLQRHSLLDAWIGSGRPLPPLSGAGEAPNSPDRLRDRLHPASLQVLDHSGEFTGFSYPAGALFLGFRRARAVALFRMEPPRLIAFIEGPWMDLHDARLLEDGRLLLFDSLARESPHGRSRVSEWEGSPLRETWRFEGRPDCQLDSPKGGAVQPLERGHRLITESTAGRAFEIDGGGKVCWEFVLPLRGGPGGRHVPYLCPVTRYPSGCWS